MPESTPPVGLGSNDLLGPLPEPDGWAVRETYYPEKTAGLGAVRFGGRGFERYTADQLRAAVAAERERCASIVENADTPDGWSNLHIAERIRLVA